jgi:RNA polymerase sigma-70 factor, ECF subfamily
MRGQKQMEKWQTGDIVAFESLFRQNERQVFRTAYLIVGSKEEAEDVLQEVFLSAWRSRETYDPAKAKLITWLHRITVNQCMNNRRKDTANTDLEGLDFPESSNRQPEKILVTKYEYEMLQNALAEMDKKHRAVIVLRYFNDLPYAEIAEILDIPLGTVKSRLNQALGCLKQSFSTEQKTV